MLINPKLSKKLMLIVTLLHSCVTTVTSNTTQNSDQTNDGYVSICFKYENIYSEVGTQRAIA